MIKLLLPFYLLLFSTLALSQDAEIVLNDNFELFHSVYPTTKGFTLALAQLDTATTLKDLNKHYEEDWVQAYDKVTLTTVYKGQSLINESIDDKLTSRQKEAIRNSDNGSEIKVDLSYLPIDETDKNKFRKNNFSFKLDPRDASFPGGDELLDSYLASHISTIPLEVFNIYQLTAVNFTIDESGSVVSAYVKESSGNKAADKILLDAICNMPRWQPATYTNGEETKQDFVFTVGDKSSCTMNVLNIKNRQL